MKTAVDIAAPGIGAIVVRASAWALALFLGAALISILISLDKPVSIPVWPAAALGCGISLGLVWRFGSIAVPALMVAGTAAHLSAGIPIVMAMSVGLVQPLAALCGAALMRYLSFHSAMERMRDYLVFALSGPGLVALATSITAAVAETEPGFSLPLGALRGWAATMTGASLITPLLIVQSRNAGFAPDWNRSLIFVLLTGILMVLSQMRGLPDALTSGFSYALFCAVLVGALFQRPNRVAEMVLVAGVLGIITAGLDFGPFARAASDNERILLMFKLIFLANGALAISAVRNESRRLADSDAKRLRRLLSAGGQRNAENAATELAAELNQPLSAIRTYAEAAVKLLHGESTGTNADSVLRALEGIVHGTERASGVMRARRQFQDAGDLPHADLNRAVERALDSLKWELQSHRISVDKRLADDLPPAISDDEELERIMVLALHIALEFATRRPPSLRRPVLSLKTWTDPGAGTVCATWRIAIAGGKANPMLTRNEAAVLDYQVELERMRAAGGSFAIQSCESSHEILITLPTDGTGRA